MPGPSWSLGCSHRPLRWGAEMMTVRFPNGQAVHYNTATYATRRSEFTDLYTEEGGDWVAQVPNSCIIEMVPACCVYNALDESRMASDLLQMASDLMALKRRIPARKKAKR